MYVIPFKSEKTFVVIDMTARVTNIIYFRFSNIHEHSHNAWQPPPVTAQPAFEMWNKFLSFQEYSTIMHKYGKFVS